MALQQVGRGGGWVGQEERREGETWSEGQLRHSPPEAATEAQQMGLVGTAGGDGEPSGAGVQGAGLVRMVARDLLQDLRPQEVPRGLGQRRSLP